MLPSAGWPPAAGQQAGLALARQLLATSGAAGVDSRGAPPMAPPVAQPSASGAASTAAATPSAAARDDEMAEPAAALLGALVPGLRVASTSTHDAQPVGLIGLNGMWTVVLTVRSDQQIVARVGEADTLPLDALVPLLSTAGIILDAIQVVVINSPGSASLPENSAALASHLELLGGLPTAARRRVFVALRLDPLSCPQAIHARGDGVVGAHRAMAATAARAVSALAEAGFEMRTMHAAETASAIAAVAGLHRPDLGPGSEWADRWADVSIGSLLHRSFVVTGWGAAPPGENPVNPLDQLGNIRARAVSTSVSISGTPQNPQLTATVRATAATAAELSAAELQLLRTAELVKLDLGPSNGFQYEAFVAGLPLGGPEVKT
jgi:type VII secretion protein EccE